MSKRQEAFRALSRRIRGTFPKIGYISFDSVLGILRLEGYARADIVMMILELIESGEIIKDVHDGSLSRTPEFNETESEGEQALTPEEIEGRLISRGMTGAVVGEATYRWIRLIHTLTIPELTQVRQALDKLGPSTGDRDTVFQDGYLTAFYEMVKSRIDDAHVKPKQNIL